MLSFIQLLLHHMSVITQMSHTIIKRRGGSHAIQSVPNKSRPVSVINKQIYRKIIAV